MSDRVFSLALAILFFGTLSTKAHAYIDPGTGSMLTQMLVAGTVGGIFTVKTFWKNFKSYVAQRGVKRECAERS